MFERFSDGARRVVVVAQGEAAKLRHGWIGTEHLLLGLLGEGDGNAARALHACGVTLPAARAGVETILGLGSTDPVGHVPFTARARRVLELGLREALQLGTDYVGTEHLLLGILREGEGVAIQVLGRLDVATEAVRDEVVGLLRGAAAIGGALSVGDESSPRCPTCLCGLAEAAPRIATVPATADTAAGTGAIRMVYCGHCGAVLGVLPDGDHH